jgi:hypothetical protein
VSTTHEAGPVAGGVRAMSILGFVFGGVAVFLIPPLFGLAGLILGIIAKVKGDPLGLWAAIVAGVGLVVGMILGVMVFAEVAEDVQALVSSLA